MCNRSFDGNSARLAGIPVACGVRHAVLGIPNTANSPCACHGRIYARQIVGMYKASRFPDRCGLHVMPMDKSCAGIPFQATSGKICAESTEFGPIKGELKA